MKKIAILLSLGAFLTVSCEKREQDTQVLNVNFTPCQQTKASGNELSDKVDVEFTNEGVKITYYNFEVTCDFSVVDVTHTLVNGVLNITQHGSPNQAKCICHTDVSYTINGISQNEVNVIFINGIQVYCHNNNENEGEYKDLEGIYFGTFTVRYCSAVPEWWLWNSESGKTTLELKNGKFTCTGNSNKIPAGGFGNYSINNDKIMFEDVNYWTANFDWGLILNGEYEYKFVGKNLKLDIIFNRVLLIQIIRHIH